MLPQRAIPKQPHPSLSAVSKPCFAAMQSKKSLSLTFPYHKEEHEEISRLLKDVENFIAIGCAHMRYADLALANCRTFTAIEPSLNDNIPEDKMHVLKSKRGVNIVPKNFEDVTEADLHDKGRRVFFFLFNVFPYIDNALENLKKLARQGDLVVISGWNNGNEKACELQKKYYGYLKSEFGDSVALQGSSAYIDLLEEEGKSIASSTCRIKGKTTDILTMRIK